MKKSPYLPTDDLGKSAWLNNFSAKFAGIASQFGFPAADVGAVQSFAIMFSYLVTIVIAATTEKEERVRYKNLIRSGPIGSALGAFPQNAPLPATPPVVPAGIFLIVAGIVQRIKNNPNYTEAISVRAKLLRTREVALRACVWDTKFCVPTMVLRVSVVKI